MRNQIGKHRLAVTHVATRRSLALPTRPDHGRDPSRMAALFLTCLICFISGCSIPRIFHSKSVVETQLAQRTQVDGTANRHRDRGLNSIHPKHPITVDQAIATALGNNAGFHAALAQMGMAEGDYLQASLLTNPSLWTVIPVSVKQWEWTLYVPIEAFLLRPEKMSLAEKELERVAHELVQNGLKLVRDVRVAYVDVELAMEKHQIALSAESIREEVKRLTESQLEGGDIAELEVIQARVDALNAKANTQLLAHDVQIATERLALLMGTPEQADSISIQRQSQVALPTHSLDQLICLAVESRPDLQAAEWAICAAENRLRLANKAWWRIDGLVDANGSGFQGYENGPGFRFDLPIFNKNQGGIKRASAELEAASYNRDQTHDQIVQQVRTAHLRLQQATENVDALNATVIPPLEEALSIAKKGFEKGATSYLLVLQTTTQYIDARNRLLAQTANGNRAGAELEFAVGTRLHEGRFHQNQIDHIDGQLIEADPFTKAPAAGLLNAPR